MRDNMPDLSTDRGEELGSRVLCWNANYTGYNLTTASEGMQQLTLERILCVT